MTQFYDKQLIPYLLGALDEFMTKIRVKLKYLHNNVFPVPS